MNTILIETVTDHKTEWGLSLTNHNPNPEDYFQMDKDTAIRLKERLESLATPPQPVTEGKANMYIVTAYRWQNKEKHSYPVGVFTSEQLAIDAAEMETAYRGGLYSCSVDQCFADYYNQNLPNYTKEVYQTQIPEHYKKATSTPSPTPTGDWEAEAARLYPYDDYRDMPISAEKHKDSVDKLRQAHIHARQMSHGTTDREVAAKGWDASKRYWVDQLQASHGSDTLTNAPDRETFLDSLNEQPVSR